MTAPGGRTRRGTYLALGLLTVVLAAAGLLALRGGGEVPSHAPSPPISQTAGNTSGPAVTGVPGVPDRAYATLIEIDAGRWPDSADAPGTKGGDRWMNRGGDLPAKDAAGRTITYREWDVNPKQRNRSRDAERIVTGTDGSAWYTGDHYETFTRMR